MSFNLTRWVKYRLRHHPTAFRWVRGARRRLRMLAIKLFPRNMWDAMVARVETGEAGGWLDSEVVEQEHIRPQVSGDPQVNYLEHFVRTHYSGGPAERALSLGCGGGNLERALMALGAARHIDAWDSSPESIKLARELAESEGLGEQIQYGVADVDRIELPEASYDFVIAKMSLHHFSDLEHVYAQICRALKPGGLFVFNEFVGPNRFQWTDLQMELINEALRTFPDRQRTVPVISRPAVEDVIAEDPTESVRSEQIMTVLTQYFEIVELKPYGGTLLNQLLTETLPAFDLQNADQRAFLRLLFLYERTLIQHRVLPADFAYVVARPLGSN